MEFLPLRCAVLSVIVAALFAQSGPPPVEPPKPRSWHEQWPLLPGGKWRSKDPNRPKPAVITPGRFVVEAPSDAIVLFDGSDLSQWYTRGKRKEQGQTFPPRWKIENGYMEVIPLSGDLVTRENFRDVQLHIEWAAPTEITGSGQGRGNSGVMLMGQGEYEIQILDSRQNETYADGQSAALYGQWPPQVNASRPPGEWQSYDIVFEAPVFENDHLVEPAFVTVLHNGVMVHHRRPYLGQVRRNQPIVYEPHPDSGPIILQEHRHPVRFRTIWVRRLNLRGR